MRETMIELPAQATQYAVHEAVHALFAGRPGGTVHREFIYRRLPPAGGIAQAPALIVVRGQLESAGEAVGWEVQEFVEGQILAFSLLAWPRRRRPGSGGKPKMKENIPFADAHDGLRLGWIERQGQKCGFRLPGPVSFVKRSVPMSKPGFPAWHVTETLYAGHLVVTDSGLFNDRYRRGFGDGAAMGYGLMLAEAAAVS